MCISKMVLVVKLLGLPLWLSWCGRPGFHSWVGKIPWRRERLPIPVFWPEEFHGQYSPWGRKESDTTERLTLSLSLLVYSNSLDFSSVQFSHSVGSDSLRPHESQHARPPCPSPTPRVHSDSRPSSQ